MRAGQAGGVTARHTTTLPNRTDSLSYHRSSDRRDAKVVAAVACPKCGAQAGQPCRNPIGHDFARGPQDHRPQPLRPHSDRRAAWSESKRDLAPERAREIQSLRKTRGPQPRRKFTCDCGAKLSAAEVRVHKCGAK